MKKSSINDVAKHAGVSTATVSHVINGTRFVSEETKQKVLQAIEELGYFPSAVARGLASQKSKIVGVVFSDISNPFFTAVYKGIEEILTKQGYELTLANTGEEENNQEVVLNTMFSRQVDGVIIAPTGKPSRMLDRMLDQGIPVILIDRGGPYHGTSLIGIDNYKAAYEATSHLIQDGHQKIGLIVGLSNVETTTTRLAGYKAALSDHGIPYVDEYISDGQSKSEGGFKSVLGLLGRKSPPTAIFSTNNLMTLGALHALRDLKLECPEDIGLIGFDDHDWADIFTPPLTVVRQPTYQMGKSAAELLLTWMRGEESDSIGEIQNLDGELIVRGSCSKACSQKYLESLVMKK